MVTVKSSNFYTTHALKSFFKYTKLKENDEFILIDNDNCSLDMFSNFTKVKLLKNNKPLNFAENVNQGIEIAIKNKKNLFFLTNDIIFTESWIDPLLLKNESISIPSNNQIFNYQSTSGNLKLKTTMNFHASNENYKELEEIVEEHKKKFKKNQQYQTLLMPFFCFKIPYKILSEVGYFDTSYGTGGGEDVDYRIRSTLKNYEVNFILDSYLLHFHGKSTWAVETLEQTKKRNEAYIKVFLKKWGNEINQIFIIRKNFSHILEEKNLQILYKKGRFGDLIRKILL